MAETISIDQRVQKLISNLTRNSDGIVEWGSFLPNNIRKPAPDARRSSSSSSSRSRSSSSSSGTTSKPSSEVNQTVNTKSKVPTDSSRLKEPELQQKIYSILKAMTQPLDPLLSPLHIPDTIIVHKPTSSVVSPDKINAHSTSAENNSKSSNIKCEKCDKPGHTLSSCPEIKELKRKKREDEEASIREKYQNLMEETKRLKSKLTENEREIRKITTTYPFVLNPPKNP